MTPNGETAGDRVASGDSEGEKLGDMLLRRWSPRGL